MGSVCVCLYTLLYRHTNTHNTHNGILFCLKKEGNQPFATTRMSPEDIVLNEINQAKTNHLHVESNNNDNNNNGNNK